MTLHSNGTSKFGRSYSTFGFKKDDGTLLVVGMREVGGADAQSQLDLFEEVFDEVCESFGNEKENLISKSLVSNKNLMSDRCATQKKFNNLFIEFRKNVLPHTIKNFNDLSLEQQKKMANVNQFFCGLHYLVGLADQGEACLKVWERILFKDQKVGSLCHGGYSNGESRVTRLIRTACKSVQERGCEKPGRMVSFASYVKDEFDITSIPLYPFLGNRFNILFLNGAGVHFRYDMLLDFFGKIELNNKLLEPVHWDLNVSAYQVAVGLWD